MAAGFHTRLKVRSHALAGLADLVGVGAPPLVRDHAGATDRGNEQRCELLDRGEPRFGADPRVPPLTTTGAVVSVDALRDLHPVDRSGCARIRRPSTGTNSVTVASPGSRPPAKAVQCTAEYRELRSERCVLEEASAPPDGAGSATASRVPRARHWPRTCSSTIRGDVGEYIVPSGRLPAAADRRGGLPARRVATTRRPMLRARSRTARRDARARSSRRPRPRAAHRHR